MLQLRVICCVLLLVAGRIVNLYVPIYYKWIGDDFLQSFQSANLIIRYVFQ